jgi:molybdopterin-containing oxidoreductase family membrane subunit
MVLEFLPVVADSRVFDKLPQIQTIRNIAHFLHKGAPILALLGLGISLLHQSSLGATYGIVKSRPIWFKPSMPMLFIISAVSAGPALTMAVAIVIEWITGKRKISHDILRTVAKFSGFGLLVYGYLKFWDLAAVSYYGRTPAVNEALNMLRTQTPYNFSFWVFEVILGVIVPAILFIAPRFNRSQVSLVLGAILAVMGIIVNRWNVTVSGLFVPLSYSPGTLYQLEPGKYFPNLVEWGIASLIIGYALLLITLGVKFLPLFEDSKGHA